MYSVAWNIDCIDTIELEINSNIQIQGHMDSLTKTVACGNIVTKRNFSAVECSKRPRTILTSGSFVEKFPNTIEEKTGYTCFRDIWVRTDM